MLRTLVLVLAFAASAAQAAPFKGSVSFKADVANPIHDFTFDGDGASAEGDDVTGITVKLDAFKTGADGRDEHMQKVLDTKKWPTAKLVVKQHGTKSFSGELTLHGVTKPVSGDVDGKTASFDVKLSDFGITQADVALAALKLQVKDIVHVKVEAQ